MESCASTGPVSSKSMAAARTSSTQLLLCRRTARRGRLLTGRIEASVLTSMALPPSHASWRAYIGRPTVLTGAVLQKPPYRSHQLLVRHRTERPGPPALDRLRPVAMAGDCRSRQPPDPVHPL